MKKSMVILFVMVLFSSVFMANQGMALTLQPWTETETSQFQTDNQNANAGSGWDQNTLTLNYGDDPNNGPVSGSSYLAYRLEDFIPSGVIGMYFEFSATTEVTPAQIWTQAWTSEGGAWPIVEQKIRNPFETMDFIGNIFRPFENYSYDIDEVTDNGVTTVEWLFVEDILTAPEITFNFTAYGYASGGTGYEAGATTFSNVSWIIDDGTIDWPFPDPTDPYPTDPIPEPSTILLFSSGLIGLAGLRRKFRK